MILRSVIYGCWLPQDDRRYLGPEDEVYYDGNPFEVEAPCPEEAATSFFEQRFDHRDLDPSERARVAVEDPSGVITYHLVSVRVFVSVIHMGHLDDVPPNPSQLCLSLEDVRKA